MQVMDGKLKSNFQTTFLDNNVAGQPMYILHTQRQEIDVVWKCT